MAKTTCSYKGVDYWYQPNPHGEGWEYKADIKGDTMGIDGGDEQELIIWIHTLICWKLNIPVWSRSTHGDWVLECKGKVYARSNHARCSGELPYHILPEHPAYERLKIQTAS
jgi:hypothetical protein